jgi:hypothetical protein
MPAEPAVATIKLKVVTIPKGAQVYRESEPLDSDTLVLVRNDKEVKLTAQLPGYDDAELTVNPLERDDGRPITLVLKKSKGERKTTKIKPAAGAGSGSGAGGSGQANKTGGELGTNPFGNK